MVHIRKRGWPWTQHSNSGIPIAFIKILERNSREGFCQESISEWPALGNDLGERRWSPFAQRERRTSVWPQFNKPRQKTASYLMDIKNDSQSNQGQTFAEVQKQRGVLEVVRIDTQSAPPEWGMSCELPLPVYTWTGFHDVSASF